MQSLTTPEALAEYLLHDPKGGDHSHTVAAITHRQNLVHAWQIQPGARVLEIGCGQGDCTVVLADAVGPGGHVIGVDPAPKDYGTPPMAQAHDFVRNGALGSRITFVQQDPFEFLQHTTEIFDYIVLSHCIWYFASPALLTPMLSLAHPKGKQLLIAEYSISTSSLSAVPHVLVALTINALESARGDFSTRNIRCALTTKQMTSLALDAGWKCVESQEVAPAAGQRDGFREVWMMVYGHFDRDVDALLKDEKFKFMLRGMKEAVEKAVSRLPGGLENVENMDVWVAKFAPNCQKSTQT